MIDLGHGEPLVLVPGIQGRWEWMGPTVERLSSHYRVITYSLCDEPSSGFPCDAAAGFDNYLRQLETAMDRARLERATLVGVSYGGLIAAEFAARQPHRVSRLVLASALPIGWEPDRRARFYLRAPWLLSPLFVATAPLRLRPEVRAAFPHAGERMRFLVRHGLRVLKAPMSPPRMARRVRWAEAHRFADLEQVQAPVLVVTGEPGLDRVVPVELSQRTVDRVRQARHVVIPGTGHLGIVTRPDRFCDVVADFFAAGA